ncbi:unnamed protein product [Spirodela intermedia]|uniref:Uncharacterized protein n=1 Tax=Spirodela intermedia TaxID=51605 RepID=A0A7I8IH53_SPIIN|nr:unnamed protein product [Spirodela intermedia]CAA2618377.1 unnamed protein product [Spirodela intermedia]CAA6657044.1 unnamed protein product [Spirodela intermedia]CAA6658094.1 unnamed protein product [Spirodela intermedia]
MKWVVESSPAAVTRQSGKTATCGSPAAVTRRRGAGWRWARVSGSFILRSAARGGSSSHLVRSQEVATRLPADRPLPDDGLFVDQSEMIYSMDCDPFIANRSVILVAMLCESR